MELVEGDDLSALIAQGPMPLSEALPIARQIADALEAAHEQNIIHRDLKPQNIMIGSFGEVLVLDWGVAKLTEKPYTDFTNQSVQSVDGFNTNAGTVIGTRDYMSPEQARGEIDQLDERADVYSLGAVLHFLLKDQPKLSKAAQAICLKARADQKENRYSTASELSADIGRLLDAEPVSAYRESAIEKASRWVSKNRFLVLLVLAYVLMRVFLVFTSQP